MEDIVYINTLIILVIVPSILARRRVEYLTSMVLRKKVHYCTPNEIRSLIQAKMLPGRKPNHLEPPDSRSLMNQSLKRTFGIQNAFTTSDEIYVVQALTLRAILKVFFFFDKEDGLQDVEFKQLGELAQAINDAWIKSKSENNLLEFRDNRYLRDTLTNVMPRADILDPRKNPLNFILPGFETMWRVVLRGFIEVAYKTGKEHPSWRNALILYSQEPTAEVFNRAYPPDVVSANFLVKEMLRVYPPTKRIYRAWMDGRSAEPLKLAADIESCYLSTNIWGPTAEICDPLRWNNVTNEQQEAFLPFGSKPFECPAKPVFGPRLIGLLVGILIAAFPDGCKLISSDAGEVFGPERLSNKRCMGRSLKLSIPSNYDSTPEIDRK
ncbi:conserved hypothetical protein [Talaromyces stipitatus ATCC 10500]|uniref:Cytochrome P450 n=1 Tax=Talaromyces stipitatus (strain ATCC 10500 / CBS 375.48 / QM 6759 / NRRL 1006) TaxID=441959 RepID=B8LX18_TALSN|nr:uncharacterized protein TSTA_061560 [Talaromyces stipitatus ATCC 10500]EED22668.1 conserved hypothetical protein [Talaromyces stipitatus ATCC 10500]